MLVAIAYAALLQQKLGPVLPPSTSPAFQQAVLTVEAALQDGDFAKAKSLLWLLPKNEFAIQWDDTKVPEASRKEFAAARDQALDMWKKQIPNLKMSIKPKGDVKISFEPVLAKQPDSAYVAAHVGFFREDSSDCRLDFVIGLKRGLPLQTTGVNDVFDDVAFAVGQYLGVAEGKYDNYTMGHSDVPRFVRTQVSRTEFHTIQDNMRAILELEKAIRDQTPVQVTKSDLFVDPETVIAPPTLQGERLQLTFQITNRGNGPLAFSMFPDCGCTIVDDPGRLEGQGSRLLRIAVDTRMFSSDMEKHVVLYTNDPANPVRVITFKIPILKRYQLIIPDGATVIVPKAGKRYDVYLIPAAGTKLEPISERFDGLDATVTRKPFKGVLADPDSHEGPKMRVGTKYEVFVKGNLPPGRSSGTLQIFTENPEFPNITVSMNAQSGIIALPDYLQMGTVGKAPRTFGFLVSGPGIPFKIETATSSAKYLKTVVSTVKGSSDFLVTVQYDGSAPRGDIISSVKVKTTDPKRPVIEVPVRGSVQ